VSPPIRLVFSNWPRYNRAFHDVVAAMTQEQLNTRPAPDRWPLWATIGHAACQRVFSLCDFGGAPGAQTTPFTNAGFDCPGDDDLETVWSAAQLADALNTTFNVVEWCLDNWTVDSMADVIEYSDGEGEPRARTRASIVQRVFAHDISHIAELNEALSRMGLAQVDLWD